MDNVILNWFYNNFSQEENLLYNECFNIFDYYEIIYINDQLINLVSCEQLEDKNLINKEIKNLINDTLDTIINQQDIFLNTNEDIFIVEKVNLIKTLLLIQNIDEPTNILALLETDLDDNEKFNEIISRHSELTTIRLEEIIDRIGIFVLNSIKELLYKKEKQKYSLEDNVELERKIIKKLKLYKNYIDNDNLLAFKLFTDNSISVGNSLKYYLDLATGEISGKLEEIADNLLSIILLTKEGYNNSYKTYKDNLELLKIPKEHIQELNQVMLNKVTNFEDYCRVHT